MKTLEKYLIESRTNPTAISKFIKTVVMELSDKPETSFNNAQQIVGAIVIGLDQGIHEIEKKVPDDSCTLEYLMDVADKLRDI